MSYGILSKLKLAWTELDNDQKEQLGPYLTFTDYREIWAMGIFLLGATALLPLLIVTIIHYQLIQTSVNSEFILRTERLTSNTRRVVTFFLDERLDALRFTVNEIPYNDLTASDRLSEILSNLKLGFGGLTDLSVIDHKGTQLAYAGPFKLKGKDYSRQPWFIANQKKDSYVSPIFKGYRNVPHIIIAVKSVRSDGTWFILRATLEIKKLMQTLSSYKTGRYADLFLIDRSGALQTPSEFYGDIYQKLPLETPKYSSRSQTVMMTDAQERHIIMGYAFISAKSTDTPFVLIVVKQRDGMMGVWRRMQANIKWFVGFCILTVIIVITIACTNIVNRLYHADKAKAETMALMEQSCQLAAIGQLSAGVAHEINNPLALISQTAGYIKDLFVIKERYRNDEELIENIDSIMEAVDRCGRITSQLLGFSRKFDIKTQNVNLKETIFDVLVFHQKEAQYRNLNLSVDVPEDIPDIETDQGKLQQILMNLVNNAFQAIDDGCSLDIHATREGSDAVSIVISDNGCGMPEENLDKIFEPFFTTKAKGEGTGLGLPITYGLVKKLNGSISVKSKENEGTTFIVTLPVRIQKEKDGNENSIGG